MKTIGLLGGMSWKTSIEYYRIINEIVASRLGGLHSAKSLMVSLDFAELEALQRHEKWAEVLTMLISAARHLERGGADFLLVCANTVHKFADAIQETLDIPLLHIADATAVQIHELGIQTVGLLGTRITMEELFYRQHLAARHGLDVRIPDEQARQTLQRIIYEELCRGELHPGSRRQVKAMIAQLAEDGAEGVILGCTELPLLLHQEDCAIPLFDTMRIHAEAAVAYALDDSG